MKIQKSWAELANQNSRLAWTALGSVLVAVIAIISILVLSSRSAVVIERACTSKVIKTASNSVPDSERDAFLREALRQRFDSDTLGTSIFLSLDEITMKERDERELKNRDMQSRVLVGSIKSLDNNRFEVDADRVISVGEVRSAFRFPLIVEVGTYARSSDNPYGLILLKALPKNKDTTENGEKPGGGR